MGAGRGVNSPEHFVVMGAPVSVNTAYKIVRNRKGRGTLAKTDAAKEWQAQVMWTIKGQRASDQVWRGKYVRLGLILYLDNWLRRDADNCRKLTQDAVAKVIDFNDARIVDDWSKKRSAKIHPLGQHVEVVIEEVAPSIAERVVDWMLERIFGRGDETHQTRGVRPDFSPESGTVAPGGIRQGKGGASRGSEGASGRGGEGDREVNQGGWGGGRQRDRGKTWYPAGMRGRQ